MRRAVLAAVLMLLVGAQPAAAWLDLAADTTHQTGWIGLYAWGTDPFTSVDLDEQVAGTEVRLRTVRLPPVVTDNGASLSGAFYPNVVRWRCDRLTRSFTAVGHFADGTTETAAFDVRTPSCRERLKLIAPREVRADATVLVRIDDTFELGGVTPRVCVQPPAGAARCGLVRLRRPEASLTFRAGVGHWVVTVSTPQQRLQAVVSAGVPPPPGTAPLPVVLATGDSEMESVDAQLSDQLVDRADVRSDVKIGSALSTDTPVNWSLVPARQVRRFDPAATVMFIGANEFFPMTTPSRAVVQCCGAPWIAEYARRVRRATQTYLSKGAKAVVWINVPLARDPRRNASVEAVDAALSEAMTGLHDASLIDIASLLTPGGVYSDAITVGGRDVRVRESDGIHLSPAGAAIAARAVVRALERLHVV